MTLYALTFKLVPVSGCYTYSTCENETSIPSPELSAKGSSAGKPKGPTSTPEVDSSILIVGPLALSTSLLSSTICSIFLLN